MKRITIGLLVWLLASQVALATPAAIDLGAANNSTSGTSPTVTVANNSPSGATILVAMLHTNTGTTCAITTPTDTAGNTYVAAVTALYPNGISANGELCIWRVYNALALSSGNSISFALTQGFATVVAVAVSGVLASPLDIDGRGNSGGGFCSVGSPLGAGITPTVNGDMLIGFCGWVNAGASVGDFTQDPSVAWAAPPTVNAYTANNIGIGGGSYVQPTAGNIDYEPSTVGNVAAYVIALKASGGGSTPQTRRSLTGVGN